MGKRLAPEGTVIGTGPCPRCGATVNFLPDSQGSAWGTCRAAHPTEEGRHCGHKQMLTRPDARAMYQESKIDDETGSEDDGSEQESGGDDGNAGDGDDGNDGDRERDDDREIVESGGDGDGPGYRPWFRS